MNADTVPCGRRLPDDQVDPVVEVFWMLADATPVQVLWALVGQEMSVNALAAVHTTNSDPTLPQREGRHA
jgi:hypothetical protein